MQKKQILQIPRTKRHLRLQYAHLFRQMKRYMKSYRLRHQRKKNYE